MGDKYLISKDTKIISSNFILANSIFERMKGLLGKKNLDDGYGMIFINSPSIHTFFMSIPIDIVFLDNNFTIISTYKNLSKNKIISCWKAKYTIEMKVNSIDKFNLVIGDKLLLEPLNGINLDDKGQVTIEYALIIAVLIIGIITFFPNFTTIVLNFISRLIGTLSDI